MTSRRLLSAVMALTGGAGQLVCHGERAWASATFNGARHEIELEFSGRADVLVGESLMAQIGNVDLDVAGMMIADVTIAAATRTGTGTGTGSDAPNLRLVLDILTLEAGS